jgi:hypothetical protein
MPEAVLFQGGMKLSAAATSAAIYIACAIVKAAAPNKKIARRIPKRLFVRIIAIFPLPRV